MTEHTPHLTPAIDSESSFLDRVVTALSSLHVSLDLFRAQGERFTLTRTTTPVLESLAQADMPLGSVQLSAESLPELRGVVTSGEPIYFPTVTPFWRRILPADKADVAETIGQVCPGTGLLSCAVSDGSPWALLLLRGPSLTGDNRPLAQFLASQMSLHSDQLLSDGRLRRETNRRLAAEEKALQSARLAGAGEMAAGLAHEIRNPLAAISNSVDWLSRKLQLEGTAGRQLEIVARASGRLNTLLTGFLKFARPGPLNRQPVDLGLLVREAVSLVSSRTDAEGVTWAVETSEDLPPVPVDRDQLMQVLENLLINAVQAIPMGSGRVEIAASRSDASAVLTVRDNGRGMSPEESVRVFDPFFSTKMGGTGLGLAISRRIIQDHGGTVVVDSTPGQGARFTVELPIAGGQP